MQQLERVGSVFPPRKQELRQASCLTLSEVHSTHLLSSMPNEISLGGKSYCPRHVQMSASPLRRAGHEGKRSYPRDGLIWATSLRRADLGARHDQP